jgi:hypothetical protein
VSSLLQGLFELEDTSLKIALDLRDVTLVDRDGVKFLAVLGLTLSGHRRRLDPEKYFVLRLF